jgi:hypothetical protein
MRGAPVRREGGRLFAVTESCHFWSPRSRLTYQSLGAVGACVFVGFAAYALVDPNANKGPVLGWSGALLLFSLVILGNAFRSGHLRLTEDHLTYQGVLRNYHFTRAEVADLTVEIRTRAPSPRKFTMPVLATTSGTRMPLPELCTPFAASIPVLIADIEVGGNAERSRESLESLAAWVQAWIASEDWIQSAASA